MLKQTLADKFSNATWVKNHLWLELIKGLLQRIWKCSINEHITTAANPLTEFQKMLVEGSNCWYFALYYLTLALIVLARGGSTDPAALTQNLSTVKLASRQLQEVKKATIPLKLSEITKLQFEELPNLRGFSCGDIVEWPSLEDVIVNYCPKLKKFGLGTINESQLKRFISDNQEQVDIDTKILHLFELSDQFSTIDKYFIEDNEEIREAIDNIRPSHFINLLKLFIKCCDERVNNFLYILTKRAHKLQDISIEQCKTLEHLFNLNELTPDKDGYGKYFTQIKALILTELHQLECIWNKDPVGIFGFENLQMVHIKGCSSLNNLFTASTAEKLTQLYELKLETCQMLEKIIQNGTIKTVKFPTLNKVEEGV
ncbi:hypothetical protein VNO80_30541 [Phaseolus coccineus]|uniref:Disease resistance protein At4g27190-like leucine-rich repeats domain-containing protein n=1 Tax=Phaseolus coccineus TaxID=3886 RepID=A0AAN9LDD2_PHACN